MPDVAGRLKRLRAWLRTHKLEGVVFRTRGNFAWLTGGADGHVVSQEDRVFGAAMVTARQALIVADGIEAPRWEAEEHLNGFQVRQHPWTKPLPEALAALAKGKERAVVSDDPAGTGFAALPADFLELRAPLSPEARRHYKALGRDCSLAVETVARSLTIGDSGFQVEADLARHLLARGVQPHLILVAFDDRLKRYRHPIPTNNHLRKVAMVVVCGRRHGLIANITRLVHFGKLPPELANIHEAVCRVEAALWHATKPGAEWGAAFKKGVEQYKREGFAKEWQNHHQGGPTGYDGRDFLVTPGETRAVIDGQAVAWNPSITGTKTEDTVLVDGDDLEVLTACSKSWPTISVAGRGTPTYKRPGILVR